MLELLMAVPLNYEMLESRCINVPKSSIEPRNGKPCPVLPIEKIIREETTHL